MLSMVRSEPFSGAAGTGADGGGSVTDVSVTGASAAVLAGLRGAFSFLVEILAIKFNWLSDRESVCQQAMHENYFRIGRAASGKVQFDLPTDLGCPQTGKGGFAVDIVILGQPPPAVKFDFPRIMPP